VILTQSDIRAEDGNYLSGTEQNKLKNPSWQGGEQLAILSELRYI